MIVIMIMIMIMVIMIITIIIIIIVTVTVIIIIIIMIMIIVVINTLLKADRPERPNITLGWSPAHPRGVLENKVSFFDFMVSRSRWHRNRGVFICSRGAAGLHAATSITVQLRGLHLT